MVELQEPPDSFVLVKRGGDYSSPYWCPGSADAELPVLEPGEVVHWAGTGWVSGGTDRKEWNFRQASIAISDRRVVYLTTNFLTEGQDSTPMKGSGLVGFAVAAAVNISLDRKRQAQKTNIALGHVRHEWIARAAFTEFKPVFAKANDCGLNIHPRGASPEWRLRIRLERDSDNQRGLMLARLVSNRLKAIQYPFSEAESGTLLRYAQGGYDRSTKPETAAWRFPGSQRELLLAGRAAFELEAGTLLVESASGSSPMRTCASCGRDYNADRLRSCPACTTSPSTGGRSGSASAGVPGSSPMRKCASCGRDYNADRLRSCPACATSPPTDGRSSAGSTGAANPEVAAVGAASAFEPSSERPGSTAPPKERVWFLSDMDKTELAQTAPPSREPAWLDDPLARASERFWNGTQWTGRERGVRD